jgi:cytochrome P450
VSRILCDPSLRIAIEEEIHPILAGDIDITSGFLQKQLDHCPILMATWHETMRTATSSISAREVLSECTIGDLQFQPGTRVIIPSRQTLIDGNVFGLDPETFDEHRFLRNPHLHNSPSFRPFGGGISYCPGRLMAKKEVIGFTAALFKNFDISLLNDKQEFPKMDTAKPCLGIMDVVDGEDLLLRVRRSVA